MGAALSDVGQNCCHVPDNLFDDRDTTRTCCRFPMFPQVLKQVHATVSSEVEDVAAKMSYRFENASAVEGFLRSLEFYHLVSSEVAYERFRGETCGLADMLPRFQSDWPGLDPQVFAT